MTYRYVFLTQSKTLDFSSSLYSGMLCLTKIRYCYFTKEDSDFSIILTSIKILLDFILFKCST